MKTTSKNHSLSLIAPFLVGVIMIACQALSSAASTATPAREVTQPVGATTAVEEQSNPAAEPTAAETDPLDHLLAMHSVKINLTALRPDGTRRVIDLEIDDKGSMHLRSDLPGPDPTSIPEGFDTNILPNGYELYILDGKVYRPDDQNPNWTTAPLEDDYLQRISRQFHGADSPGLWLDVLPEGSLQAAGQEMVGGFAADKYTVNDTIDGQVITGTFWFESQAEALVQAELHIPAALLSNPKQPQKGELTITLKAEKAEISPIKLP